MSKNDSSRSSRDSGKTIKEAAIEKYSVGRVPPTEQSEPELLGREADHIVVVVVVVVVVVAAAVGSRSRWHWPT
jgi:hypothetical protein